MAPSAFEMPLYVLPTSQHTHTVIALHGRGSQGPEVRQFVSQKFHNMDLKQAVRRRAL